MTIVFLILHKYSQSYHATAAWRLHPRLHRGFRHVAEYAEWVRPEVAEAQTQARGRPLRGSGRPLFPPQVKRRRKPDARSARRYGWAEGPRGAGGLGGAAAGSATPHGRCGAAMTRLQLVAL